MRPDKSILKMISIQEVLIALSVLTAIAGLIRIAEEPKKDTERRADQVVLMFFIASGGLLLLRDVKEMSFGGYKLEFDRKVAELQTKVENAQSLAVSSQRSNPGSADFDPAPRNPHELSEVSPLPGDAVDDPWKGVFGGSSTNANRKLSATVSRINTNNLYRIQLRVVSLDPLKDPLLGSVQFFLHQTFANDRPVVAVTPGGIAELTLSAWGAFTVGALADGGNTRLELNLADLEYAPIEFRRA